MPQEISYDGTTVGQLYQTFTKAGIDPSDASLLVASWIFENVGTAKHVFNYVELFPAVAPGCQPPSFARTFAHTDWVDGEDAVQAGQTTGELGFNERFHRIEHDLDALGTGVAQAFACMTAMRASLRKLLDEVRVELNRLHTNAHDNAALDRGILQVDKIPNYVGALDFGKYMGTTMFLDKKVSVWETKQGTIVLPALETVGVDVVAGTKLKGSAQVSRYLAERPDVRQRFPQEVRVDDFVRTFGDDELADGRTVRDVLKVLPAGSGFRSIGDMVVEIGEREAVIVRTTMGAPEAVSAALGIDTAIQSVGDADVAKLVAVPTKARQALSRAGINSVGELAKASPEKVLSIMKENQINAGAGDAAEWTAYAQTLTKLR
ncbi:hypothetical protein [Frankia sp. Cr2]|uniref:hypothetical protein n=1 Tax=Frankia sp. Cr2 TaxID=3073932 RepID=UPI002AD219DE|nr:hypothetical protein [Frankia sp. Cr2]